MQGVVRTVFPAVFAILLAGVLLAGTARATTGPALSVKSGDQWYWSVDLTDGLFNPPGTRGTTPTVMAFSPAKATKDLGLSRDQRRVLEFRLAGAHLLTGTPEPSPAFHDGTVVSSSACHGIGTSIPSSRIDVDLYHRFRCTVTGATYKRTEQLKAAIASAEATLRAAPQPKPQSLVNALASAYERLGAYRGEPVSRTLTLVVMGRKLAAIA